MPADAVIASSSFLSGRIEGSGPGRLTGKPSFERVFREGCRYRGRVLKIVCTGNTLGLTRLGFSVSAKMGCAVQRNLFRRRIREAMRQHLSIPSGLDVVVYPAVKLSETTRVMIRADLAEFEESVRRRVWPSV
jgi:ribonuclease P protein component